MIYIISISWSVPRPEGSLYSLMFSAQDHSATSAMKKHSFNSRSVTLFSKENLEIDIRHNTNKTDHHVIHYNWHFLRLALSTNKTDRHVILIPDIVESGIKHQCNLPPWYVLYLTHNFQNWRKLNIHNVKDHKRRGIFTTDCIWFIGLWEKDSNVAG
jgi:hypothetical protein